MPNNIQSTKINAAFYHSLGKVLTEATNLVGNEKYKSAHNVRSSEIWMDSIPYAPTFASASQYSDDIVVKQVGTSSNPSYLYPLTNTNYQTWFIDLGTPSTFVDGFAPSDGWVKSLINPSDVPNEAGAPSFGFELQMFRRDGTTPISYGSAFYDVDYFSGLIRFDVGYTPVEGTGLGFTFDKNQFEAAVDKQAYIQSTTTGGPRVIAWQYVGQRLSEYQFSGTGLTAGDGLTVSNDGIISVNIATQSGLSFSNNELFVNVDDSTIKFNNLNQIYVSGNSVYEWKYSLSTSGNTQPSGLTISNTPLNYSTVKVMINGQVQILGGSSNYTTSDCFFSPDGTLIRDIDDISIGDELYWNGTVTGYNLSTEDKILLIYEI